MNLQTANSENVADLAPGTTVGPVAGQDVAGGLAAILIGRNEGERLIRCLASLADQADTIIYVDSGSTDDSVARATEMGTEVIILDPTVPFTAARARNAGLRRLLEQGRDRGLVQFVDGDCEVEPGWTQTARAALNADPGLGIVAGRRRERAPGASVYNRLCDAEWDTPVGPASAVGGDMMARIEALAAIGGYRGDMIAGEEPEMCLRLARAGWRIERLDAPMTLHDADMHRFGQWWRRARRAGHAFAEGNWLHGDAPEAFWRREVRRALVWAVLLPLAILVMALITGPWALILLLIYPLQVARLSRQLGWVRASFLTLAKFPEAQGIMEFHLRRLAGRKAGLIEYK